MKSRVKNIKVSSGSNPQVIGNKWKPIFLWQLRAEKMQFSELQQSIRHFTQNPYEIARELEEDGLILRESILKSLLKLNTH